MKKTKPKRTPLLREYDIHLNETQVQALIFACEVHNRLCLAQIDTALSLTLMTAPTEKRAEIRDLCDKLKYIITGLPSNASYGVSCKEFGEQARIVSELFEVLRHRLAWDRCPTGGYTCDFSPVLKLSQQPLPKITCTDTVTTDGWSKHKPVKVKHGEKYLIRMPDQTHSPNTVKIVKSKDHRYNVVNESIDRSVSFDSIADDLYHWKKI
jgi:hypothetical protein